nr:hypothetical protein [uncultured Acidovorax sp.]
MTLQTQEQANAYWVDKDYKKWVVEFKAGSRRKPKRWQVNVGAANTNGARRAGLAAADLMGHSWCRSAMSTVRLATAQDLGCVATVAKGGAA